MEENEDDLYALDTVCPVCQAEFIEIEDLHAHINYFHKVTKGEPVTKQEAITESETPGIINHACKFCLENYFCSSDLTLHIRDQHLIDVKTCIYCVRAFLTRKDLWEHEAKHNSNDSAKFLCSNCPKMFLNLVDLEKHEVDNHSEGSEPGMMLHRYYSDLSAVLCCRADLFLQSITNNTTFVCICNFSSSDVGNYIKHVQKGKCSCLVCNDCFRVYSDRKGISRHKEKRAKTKTRQCTPLMNLNIKKCSRCFKVIFKNAFVTHKRSCRPVRCIKCDASFDSLQELSQHQLDQHRNSKVTVNSCRYCFKSIVGLEMLKNHVEKIHGHRYKEYKYNCSHCYKIFDHPRKLFGHFNSTHRDIKPFVCNFCDKEFILRSKFTYHIKMAHESKGFVEFTKDLHVHFNINKSSDPFIPKPPSGLFSPEELELFKNNGIKLTDLSTLERSQVEPRNKIPTSANNKSINIKENVEDKTAEEEAVNPEDNSEEITENNEYNSSDDEPIQNYKRKNTKKRYKLTSKLICNICMQKCFTKDNYTRHMESHKNKGLKQCLKCSKKFKTISRLQKHIEETHAATTLIKMLRDLKEKRKTNKVETVPKKSPKFVCKILKVLVEPDYRCKARIVKLNLDDPPPVINKSINNNVLVRLIDNRKAQAKKKHVIEMRKFVKEDTAPGKMLQMPTAFEKPDENYTPAVIKFHEGPITHHNLNFGDQTEPTPLPPELDEYQDDNYFCNDDIHDHNDNINEDITISDNQIQYDPVNIKLEQEVPVESNEIVVEENEVPVVPKRTRAKAVFIPNEATQKWGVLKVATMVQSNDGPKYEIIPFKLNQKQEEVEYELVELPGAPKLVRSNPLAHLLGDSEVVTKRKYYNYKPKISNPQLQIAKALKELQSPCSKYQKPKKLGRGRKSNRKVSEEMPQYEVLDEQAEDWAMESEK